MDLDTSADKEKLVEEYKEELNEIINEENNLNKKIEEEGEEEGNENIKVNEGNMKKKKNYTDYIYLDNSMEDEALCFTYDNKESLIDLDRTNSLNVFEIEENKKYKHNNNSKENQINKENEKEENEDFDLEMKIDNKK